MTYSYLIRSRRHLLQYVASNLAPKGYWFYSTSWIPEGKDEVLTDAKLTLLYDAHFPKEKQYRRSKAGHARVKYLRCGRLCLLFATKGKSPFFEREAFKDLRESPLHVAGQCIKVHRESGKVCVSLHQEARRSLRRFLLEHSAYRLDFLEKAIRNLPFLAFAGTSNHVYKAVEELNENRKSLRLPPVEWENCVRRRFKVEPVFLESPPELLELLRYHGERKPLVR